MKPSITVNMNLSTRPAIYTPRRHRLNLGLTKGSPVDVDVFGIYQVADGEDVDAYFVIKLRNGQCAYAAVDDIRFTDMEEQE